MTSGRLAQRSVAAPTPKSAGASRPGVRSQILEAALTEFAGKGFQEASLAAIARRLGVTAPLVLYHFGSKANLWREALEVFCANFDAVVALAVEDGRSLDGREALRLLVRRLVHFFATNRAAYRLMRDESGAEPGQAEWFTSKSLRPIIEKIESVYRRAVDEGVVRPAPFETTFFMILGATSCYLESRVLVSRLFGGTLSDGTLSDGRVSDGGNVAGTDWIDNYADQVVGLCFDGLTAPRRSDTSRPMLAAVRTPPRTATTTTSEATLS